MSGQIKGTPGPVSDVAVCLPETIFSTLEGHVAGPYLCWKSGGGVRCQETWRGGGEGSLTSQGPGRGPLQPFFPRVVSRQAPLCGVLAPSALWALLGPLPAPQEPGQAGSECVYTLCSFLRNCTVTCPAPDNII